jgi:beta-galactosidase
MEADPDRDTFGHLKYPPFMVDLIERSPWTDVKIEGYIGGKLVKTQMLSGSGKDIDLKVLPDDTELFGDGRDATRVVLMIVDEYGNMRPFASAAISFSLTGPGELIGENPLALAGGAGAVWVKAKEGAGVINLTAKHAVLGTRSISIEVKPAPPEMV